MRFRAVRGPKPRSGKIARRARMPACGPERTSQDIRLDVCSWRKSSHGDLSAHAPARDQRLTQAQQMAARLFRYSGSTQTCDIELKLVGILDIEEPLACVAAGEIRLALQQLRQRITQLFGTIELP